MSNLDIPSNSILSNDIRRTLNKIDKEILKINVLQKDVKKNRAALKKSSSKLTVYEKKLEELKHLIPTRPAENSQLQQVDLQRWVQKQELLLTMLTQIQKQLHDTIMAIFRKLNG